MDKTIIGLVQTYVIVVIAMAGTAANAGDYTTRIPDSYTLRESLVANHYFYPRRAYLDELPSPLRIQDKRRIRIRYDHVIEMGQTKIYLRLKAKPKPRKIVQIELRF